MLPLKPKLKPNIISNFGLKPNLNNPVSNLISVMHRDRRFFLKTSL